MSSPTATAQPARSVPRRTGTVPADRALRAAGAAAAPREWVERVSALIAEGRVGRAMVSFLTEIIGLTAAQIEELKNAPGAADIFPIVTATMPREAQALTSVDPLSGAGAITCPVLLLLGEHSPPGRATSAVRWPRRCPPPNWPSCPARATRPSTPIPGSWSANCSGSSAQASPPQPRRSSVTQRRHPAASPSSAAEWPCGASGPGLRSGFRSHPGRDAVALDPRA